LNAAENEADHDGFAFEEDLKNDYDDDDDACCY